MATRDEFQQMATFLSTFPTRVSRELTVVVNEDENKFLYHISANLKLKRLAPRVSLRVMEGENHSVPRIATAPTIAGCIRGYCSDISDFTRFPSNSKEHGGRWCVYGLPYKMALRPSKTLLPDVQMTNEHWLVNYGPDVAEYQPIVLAKYFYQSLKFTANPDGLPTVDIDLFLEVTTDTPVQFSHDLTLTKGYWNVRVCNLHGSTRWNRGFAATAEPIAEKLFADTRKLVASTLSLESMKPPSAHW